MEHHIPYLLVTCEPDWEHAPSPLPPPPPSLLLVTCLFTCMMCIYIFPYISAPAHKALHTLFICDLWARLRAAPPPPPLNLLLLLCYLFIRHHLPQCPPWPRGKLLQQNQFNQQSTLFVGRGLSNLALPTFNEPHTIRLQQYASDYLPNTKHLSYLAVYCFLWSFMSHKYPDCSKSFEIIFQKTSTFYTLIIHLLIWDFVYSFITATGCKKYLTTTIEISLWKGLNILLVNTYTHILVNTSTHLYTITSIITNIHINHNKKSKLVFVSQFLQSDIDQLGWSCHLEIFFYSFLKSSLKLS